MLFVFSSFRAFVMNFCYRLCRATGRVRFNHHASARPATQNMSLDMTILF